MVEQVDDSGLFVTLLQILERIQAPYMIVGAYAAILYGLMRSTYDIDIVVDLSPEDVTALADAFPPPRYYADIQQMRDSIRQGIMFNIVDTTFGTKADLVPMGNNLRNRSAMQHRTRQLVILPGREPFEVWCARPEDVIVGKLNAWAEGRSSKHKWDIQQMLTFGGSRTAPGTFDLAYVDAHARQMGDEVVDYWRSVWNAVHPE